MSNNKPLNSKKGIIFLVLALLVGWSFAVEAVVKPELVWDGWAVGRPHDDAAVRGVKEAKLVVSGVSDFTNNKSRGVVALQIERISGTVLRVSIEPTNLRTYEIIHRSQGAEFLLLDIVVVRGGGWCPKGTRGKIELREGGDPFVDGLRLSLPSCGINSWVWNRFLNAPAKININNNISGKWAWINDPAGAMVITRKRGTKDTYVGRYRGRGAHNQLFGTLIGKEDHKIWSGNFKITELGNVVSGTFRCSIETSATRILRCSFNGGNTLALREIN